MAHSIIVNVLDPMHGMTLSLSDLNIEFEGEERGLAYREEWEVSDEDFDAHYAGKADSETGEYYVLFVYRNGERNMYRTDRMRWEQIRAALEQ